VLPFQPSRSTPRHTAVVRATHWITTLCSFALLVSGTYLFVVFVLFHLVILDGLGDVSDIAFHRMRAIVTGRASAGKEYA